MFGILLIDKPLEFSSHDVVAVLRRKLNTKRVGHAGTLDPLATGLLVIAVGPATRFLQYLDLEPKVYQARIEFGIETDTYDREGEVVAEKPVPADLEAQVANAIQGFLGTIEQLPPMYSAVKVKGKPLYKYARDGVEIERKPREVHIERYEIHHIEGNMVDVEIECSGGTYVRTLAHDLGQAIGCGAHLNALVRTQIGDFYLDEAVGLEGDLLGNLIPLSEALSPMPIRELNLIETMRVRNGGNVPNTIYEQGSFVALADPDGNVISVASVIGNDLKPECVIPVEAPNDIV
ncbi:MAG TPA: tRNA pseudouridine(55) synthase TruB [Fimbriimonas sp.]|nr:tRNA pseudouridine(55) synthase TruB [Fimbriimonas sp.]